MSKAKEIEYSRFTQYYIEILDELRGLETEAEELLENDELVPQSLASEIFRHTFLLETLTQAGEKLYSKTQKELYNDGWHFWYKEDKELREKRYGGQQ